MDARKRYLAIGGLALAAILLSVPMASAFSGSAGFPGQIYQAILDIQTKTSWILGNITTTIQDASAGIEGKLWSNPDSVKNDTKHISDFIQHH